MSRWEHNAIRGWIVDRRLSIVSAGMYALFASTAACSLLLRSGDATYDGGAISPAPAPQPVLAPASPLATSCGLELEPQHIKAPKPLPFAWYGTTLAADGDTLVVAAPMEFPAWQASAVHPGANRCEPSSVLPERNIAGTGAVYVYERTSDGWFGQQLKIQTGDGPVFSLIPSEITMDPYRGGNYSTWSMAVSNDQILVGLAGDSARGPFRGSLHSFVRTPQGFVEQFTPLPDPDDRNYDLFGMSVAIVNDLIAVGAPGASMAADPAGAGAVFVYRLTLDGFEFVQRLRGTEASSLFGTSVALSSEWLVVGAPLKDAGNPQTEIDWGAAYVYRWTGSQFEQPVILNGNGNAGTSLALSEDTVAVGVPTGPACNGKFQARGSVLMYSLDAKNWPMAGELESDTCLDVPDENVMLFGYSIALEHNTLLVGAPWTEDSPTGNADSTGRAHVFRRTESGWKREATCPIPAPHRNSCDCFGMSVAITPSMIAVGSPLDDRDVFFNADPLGDTLIDSGGLFIYRRNQDQ